MPNTHGVMFGLYRPGLAVAFALIRRCFLAHSVVPIRSGGRSSCTIRRITARTVWVVSRKLFKTPIHMLVQPFEVNFNVIQRAQFLNQLVGEREQFRLKGTDHLAICLLKLRCVDQLPFLFGQLPTSPILVGKHVVMRRPLVDGVYIEYLIMDGNTVAAKQISIPDESTCADAIKRLRAATHAEPEKHSRPQKPRAFRIREAS
ncbi:beta-hexosaminidase [Burkholderia pseudomallei]|nr:beta-hexosaminidase [Burkholderia pseudomallei]